MLSGNDSKDAQRGGLVLINTAINAGIEADQNVSKSGRDPQSAYTPVINQMKADGSNYSLITMATNNAIQLRSEAQLQGLTDPDIVWMCTTCYDASLKDHADVMNHSLMRLSFLPFEEASTNAMLANFVKYVGKDKADSFSVYGWTATLAFAEAAKAVVEKGGVNAFDPSEPARRRYSDAHQVRRRWHDRRGEPGGQDPERVLHDRPVRGRQVRARLPVEEGDVRLQGVEQREDQSGPDRLTRR